MSEHAARWRTPSAGVFATCLLVLSGCGSTEADRPAAQTPAASSSAADAPGPAVRLPATFPADEIPLVAGAIVSASMIPGSGWNVVLTPETPFDQVADEAQRLVEAAGFTQISRSNDPSSDNRGYRHDQYDLFINLQDADGTVSYAVLTR